MNFNSLSSNEKLAVYGSIAVIVGVVIASFLSGLLWFSLLAGVAMLVVVFLPQMSAGTQLPGSKGSLMFLIGLVAAVPAVIVLLTMVVHLGDLLAIWPVQTLFMLIAVAGALVMAWAGWQEFQAEGGKFQVGSTAGAGGTGGSSGTGSTAAASSSAGQSPGVGGGSAADRGIGTEGGMGTGASAMPHGGASSGGTTGEPTAATTQGMGSTGSPATAAGSTSAGSTDMGGGGTSTGTGSDEGTTRNP
jgi:hypothetical protein